MNYTSKIGSGQLFLFVVLSRVIITLAYGVNAGGHTISNGAWFACLLLPITLMVLGIPTLLFIQKAKGVSICDFAFTVGKKTGYAVSILYAILFFALSFSSVGRFSYFVTSTMQTNQSIWFFPILMMAAVCFGSIKGLRAIFRAGAVLSIFCIAAILAIVIALLPRFEFLNIINPFYHGASQVGYSVVMLTFSSMEMGAFLMLAPLVNGKLTKTYIGYAVVSAFFLFVVFFTVMAVLGQYATLQMFPFYGVAGVAQIGELSNLSALEAAVWMIGVFLKSAVYLHLCYDCLAFMIPKEYRSIAIVILAVLGVFSAVYTSDSLVSSKTSYALPVIIGFNVVFSVVLPVFLLILGKNKRRKPHETNALPAS